MAKRSEGGEKWMVDVTYGEVQGDNIISTHLGLGNIDGRFTVKITTPFL